MPFDHAIGTEPLQTKHAGGGRQRVGGRQPVRVERVADACRPCRRRDARRRCQADELTAADARSASLCLLDDALHEKMRSRGLEVDHVRGHLDDAPAKAEPERLDSRQAPRRLTQRGRDLARDLERRVQLDVEGDERRAHADQHGACARIERPWPVRRRELAALDAPLELRRTAAPVERRPASVAERPVEEDGQSELVSDSPGDGSGDRLRALDVVVPKGHHGDDVCRPYPGMDPVVPAEVDRATGLGDACHEPVFDRAIVPEQREPRPVVVGVDMGVDEAGPGACECATDRLDDTRVPPLGHVGDRLEREHPPTLETVREPTAPAYYHRRAPEYDDWYLGVGLYRDRERPGFDVELGRVASTLARPPAARTLDIACGTGFLTRHLRGEVTGLDASASMIAIAAERMPTGRFVQGDALALPFADDAFERVVSGHFYGHLDDDQRVAFLREARRVAPELVLVDASRSHSPVDEEWSERVLRDGSRWQVYKRYFEPAALLDEIGGPGDVLLAGSWFVVVRSAR